MRSLFKTILCVVFLVSFSLIFLAGCSVDRSRSTVTGPEPEGPAILVNNKVYLIDAGTKCWGFIPYCIEVPFTPEAHREIETSASPSLANMRLTVLIFDSGGPPYVEAAAGSFGQIVEVNFVSTEHEQHKMQVRSNGISGVVTIKITQQPQQSQ